MSGVLTKWWFWSIIILLILLVVCLRSKKVISASQGGYLEGKSHERGGIKGIIKANGRWIELEGKEGILDVNTMEIRERYRCEGTPIGIASALNVLGGSGTNFSDEGKCYQVNG